MINVRYYGTSQYKWIMKYDRRPDVIVVQKDKNFCHIKDFTFSHDERVGTKELEGIEHYQDLVRDLRKIWNMKFKVIPLVIGTVEQHPQS